MTCLDQLPEFDTSSIGRSAETLVNDCRTFYHNSDTVSHLTLEMGCCCASKSYFRGAFQQIIDERKASLLRFPKT